MRTTLLLILSVTLVGCRTLPRVTGDPIDDARRARVVAMGELHDDVAHHAYQAKVLGEMSDAAGGDPVLLGMEMFQRPYQQPLDDYVAGTIDELEMLRRTEWYSRWQYNHTMYAPLWRLARDRGIRVVALNAERDIVRQIGRKGLDSLTPEQRAQVAEDIRLDVPSHRERIMAVFSGGTHPMPEERVALLYQAQTTWDETMAESAARALDEAGPDARMMIVAGSMHVQQRDGIPGRLHRRIGGEPPLIIVNRTEGRGGSSDAPDEELGDHVVRLQPIAGPVPAKYGIGLEDDEAGGAKITQVVPGKPGAAAGMVAGDVIVTLEMGDGAMTYIADVVALKYFMDYVQAGSTRRVGLRNGAREREVSVTFPLPTPPAAHP